ncbi:putative 5'-AMP-activated kinase-like protein [Quillaja saponaria]|uniref:5'-AMP-activated kinase-like protein n=1 Tax=Quillaja saponaria TaxID=32244 RepID=A0AAD7Q002_QUISA|nr:putative 5'-AMP-activated kinase-like protein [Quillaja saponaria]
MATLCYFPNCFAPSSRKLFLIHHHNQRLLKRNRESQGYPHLKHFLICASSTKNSRRSRKVKSNVELCNDIREFLAAVGLPEDHIPSMKELSQHGRNDLANIVRRRGYKLIRELLASPSKADVNVLDTDQSIDERLDAVDGCEDILTGQDEKVKNMDDDLPPSADTRLEDSPGDLGTDSDDYSRIPIKSSANFSLEENVPYDLKGHAMELIDMADRDNFSTKVSVLDSISSNSKEGPDSSIENLSCSYGESIDKSSFEEKSSENLEFQDNLVSDISVSSKVPVTGDFSSSSYAEPDVSTEGNKFKHSKFSAASLEQKDLCKLEDLDGKNNTIAEDVSLITEESVMGSFSASSNQSYLNCPNTDSAVNSDDYSCMNVDSMANLSLEEKAAKFIQNGDLDEVEDNVWGISSGTNAERSEGFIQPDTDIEMPLRTLGAENSEHQLHGNADVTLNGSILTSKQIVPSEKVDCLLRDDRTSAEDLPAYSDKYLDVEATQMQNQTEISHLKYMLHQKELELSRLKEQIEKEKLALSGLQTKAETEIIKARKLISKKDAELHAAEENLSGLKEVQIQFCGDGDIVEVAGSFNGWHQGIRMDPQPLSSITDPVAPRKSRLWSTVLWLYPGAYEIKFIIDGHWMLDPQRESISRGHICNNILRVDR